MEVRRGAGLDEGGARRTGCQSVASQAPSKLVRVRLVAMAQPNHHTTSNAATAAANTGLSTR